MRRKPPLVAEVPEVSPKPVPKPVEPKEDAAIEEAVRRMVEAAYT